MALSDIFKKKKEGARFERNLKEKEEVKKESAKEPAPSKEEKKPKSAVKKSAFSSAVLIAPHVTEKATALGGQAAYIFKVRKKANKPMVTRAIKEAYGIYPRKVAIVNSPTKRRFVRGKRGVKSGFKKAIVYLKKGDKIEV